MLFVIEFLGSEQSEPLVWDYVSPSRLHLWLKCPLAFRRRYIDGVTMPPSVSLFVGKVVHDVLDGIYRCASVGAYTTPKDAATFVETSWQRAMESEPCVFNDTDHETKCFTQATDLVKAYLAETDIAAEKPLAIERKFEVALIDPAKGEDIGLPFVGVVDLVLDDADISGFFWKNKVSIATGTLLITAATQPEPFINGAVAAVNGPPVVVQNGGMMPVRRGGNGYVLLGCLIVAILAFMYKSGGRARTAAKIIAVALLIGGVVFCCGVARADTFGMGFDAAVQGSVNTPVQIAGKSFLWLIINIILTVLLAFNEEPPNGGSYLHFLI